VSEALNILFAIVLILALVTIGATIIFWARVREYVSAARSSTALPEPEPPMPVVEDMEPKILTYRPREGHKIRNCHCHDKPLRPGDKVLWWPTPEGAVVLFCEQGVRERAGGA
jgi:hypothetical protein